MKDILNNNKKSLKYLFLLLPVFLLLESCLGLSMDIHLKKNGSGRITMEYIIPASFENLGRLDGNQNWPIIPVGKADWERSVARINGLKIVSYSFRQKSDDYIVNVVLDFDNLSVLEVFLGKNVSINNNEIKFFLTDDTFNNPAIDQSLIELIKEVSKGKKTEISFTADSGLSSLKIIDMQGNIINIPDSAVVVESGRKVSISLDTAAIPDYKNGLVLSFSW